MGEGREARMYDLNLAPVHSCTVRLIFDLLIQLQTGHELSTSEREQEGRAVHAHFFGCENEKGGARENKCGSSN